MSSISEKLTGAILAGRRVVMKSTPNPAETLPTLKEARETLQRFAELLRQLSAAREQMDAAAKLATDSKGVDLSELLLAGQPLPDLATLAAQAEATRLKTSALKQAVDRLANGAGVALRVLAHHRSTLLLQRERRVREQLERPSWMSKEDFERQLLRAPAMQEIALFQEVTTPHLPMLVSENGKVLKYFRVEPMQRSNPYAFGKSDDGFQPSLLADELTGWLEGLEKLHTAEPV